MNTLRFLHNAFSVLSIGVALGAYGTGCNGGAPDPQGSNASTSADAAAPSAEAGIEDAGGASALCGLSANMCVDNGCSRNSGGSPSGFHCDLLRDPNGGRLCACERDNQGTLCTIVSGGNHCADNGCTASGGRCDHPYPDAVDCNCMRNVAADAGLSSTSTSSAAVLTVAVGPSSGAGSVTSNPVGIDCPVGGCYYSVAEGSAVTLTAAPIAAWVFDHWGGDCAGSEPMTTITMDTSHVCDAVFRAVFPDAGSSACASGGGACGTCIDSMCCSALTGCASDMTCASALSAFWNCLGAGDASEVCYTALQSHGGSPAQALVACAGPSCESACP